MSSTRKLKVISEKNNFENCRLNLRKKIFFANSFFVIEGKLIFGIEGKSAQHSLQTTRDICKFLGFKTFEPNIQFFTTMLEYSDSRITICMSGERA